MLTEKRINRYVNYNNALKPLNEGFFSWLGGLIKNLFKGLFRTNTYEEFIKRLNALPRIILGLDKSNSNESKKVVFNSSINERRSRFKSDKERMLYESRSRYSSINEAEGDENNTETNTDNNQDTDNTQETSNNQETTTDTPQEKSELVKMIEECESLVEGEIKEKLEALKKLVINNESVIALKDEEGSEEVFNDEEVKKEYDDIVKYNEDLKNKFSEIISIQNIEEKKNAIVSFFDSEEVKKIKELSIELEELSVKLEELKKEKENVERENDELKDENDELNAKIENMNSSDYESEFTPIEEEEIDVLVKSKKPSFKKTLAELLLKLRDSSAQLKNKFSDENIKKLEEIVQSGRTLSMRDVQTMELNVSDFLNLYSGGSMNLPKPEKNESLTIADLAQYDSVIKSADNSKKFKTIYDSLREVIKIYEDSFVSEWKFVRETEKEYQQQKAQNASWDGDGTVNYETMKKILGHEMEIQGAMKSMIDQCNALIPNAISGFFVSSPVYKNAEETINKIVNLLVSNSKNIEEQQKNPEMKVISVFNDIMTNTINREEEENIKKASDLFNVKVNEIVKAYPNKTNFSNSDINRFENNIQTSKVKVTQKDTSDTLMKKIQDVKGRLAFACLYFVYMNKPLQVMEDIDNQKVDLFMVGEQQNGNNQNQQNNQQNNQQQNNNQNQQPSSTQQPQPQQPESAGMRRSRMKKIYDAYTWQK